MLTSTVHRYKYLVPNHPCMYLSYTSTTIHALLQSLAEYQIYANSYVMSLTSLDDQNDGDGIKRLTNMVVKNTGVAMFQVPLPFRRLWNYILLAHGCDQHPLTKTAPLSNNYYSC